MASGKMTPRQKMINMMYLVLTALLALNVSKEVLNSFFEVNLGIVKTTNGLDKKNTETYAAFEDATNQEKVKNYKNLANKIKPDALELVDFIQEMKYTLVLTVDNAVFLGEHLDEDGEEIEDNKFEVSYDKLDDIDKNKKIAFLNKKDDRNSSNQFVSSGTASKLKSMIEDYKAGLLILSNGDKNMIKEILSSLNTDDLDKESWERYNFYDMPAVGALTLLSKWQADVRGIHLSVRSHIGDMLQENGGKKLKLKDYYGAIKDYSESIKYDSSNFISYNNRGTVKYILKDYKGAIEDFAVAISLSPETTSFYVSRGNARLMIKDYAKNVRKINISTVVVRVGMKRVN